jgi:hypothetical protein
MNIHQFLSGTRKVLAAVPMLVVLLSGTTSAMAQVALLAPATPTKSTNTIVVTGTVPGPPEDVAFNKVQVQIGSTLARDPDPTLPPVLIIDITFLKAAGVGVTTKTKYMAEAQVTKVRPQVANDVIEITFPYTQQKATAAALTAAESTQFLSASPAGLATFNLTFDTNGVITGATGAIGANKFAAAP